MTCPYPRYDILPYLERGDRNGGTFADVIGSHRKRATLENHKYLVAKEVIGFQNMNCRQITFSVAYF